MAEKMDKKKKPAPTTLPVPVEQQQQQQQPSAAPPFGFAVVVVTISFGFAVIAYTFGYASRAASWLLPRAVTKLTDTDTEGAGSLASALLIGMLWCSMIQMAAGALLVLLMLLRWSVRRTATYAALAVTIGGHCMYAAIVLVLLRSASVVIVLLRADPGGLVLLRVDPAGSGGLFFLMLGNVAIFVCAVGDLLRILTLFRGREDD